jgi:hypothetical protein
LEAQQHKKYAQTTPLDDGVSSLFKMVLYVNLEIERIFFCILFELKLFYSFIRNLLRVPLTVRVIMLAIIYELHSLSITIKNHFIRPPNDSRSKSHSNGGGCKSINAMFASLPHN